MSYKGSFDNVDSFGEVLVNVKDVGGWVEGINFSPKGTRFALNVHNSTT